MKNAFTDLEYLLHVGDLINHPSMLELKEFSHHKVNNRYNHSIEVSYLAYRIALRLKLDARAVARGALLHDLYHYDTDLADKEAYKEHLITHPEIALTKAKKITEVTPIMEDMILCHMYYGARNQPKPETKEGWVVAIADKLCTADDGREVFRYLKKLSKVKLIERQTISMKEYGLLLPIRY